MEPAAASQILQEALVLHRQGKLSLGARFAAAGARRRSSLSRMSFMITHSWQRVIMLFV
jgi:hypothetical protein